MKIVLSISGFFLSVISIMIWSVNVSFARDLFVESAIDISTGLDDNPRLLVSDSVERETETETETETSSSNVGNESISILGISMQIGSQSEIDLFAFDISATARRNSDSSLNSEGYSGTAIYERYGQLKNYAVEIGLLQDSTLETELEDTGRLSENVIRKEYFITPSTSFRYSSRWDGDIEGGYRKVEFDGSDLRFIEYEETSIGATIRRSLTERFSIHGISNYILYQPTTNPEIGEIEQDESISLLVGLDVNLGPITNLSISAGPSRVKSEITGVDQESVSNSSSVFRVSLGRNFQASTYSVEGFQTSASSATGGIVELRGVNLSWSKRMSEKVEIGIGAVYSRSDSNAVGSSERDYKSITPHFSWNLTRQLSLSIQARYSEQELTETEMVFINSTAKSTYYSMSLSYDFGHRSL